MIPGAGHSDPSVAGSRSPAQPNYRLMHESPRSEKAKRLMFTQVLGEQQIAIRIWLHGSLGILPGTKA
jgi:hypothetical protein